MLEQLEGPVLEPELLLVLQQVLVLRCKLLLGVKAGSSVGMSCDSPSLEELLLVPSIGAAGAMTNSGA